MQISCRKTVIALEDENHLLVSKISDGLHVTPLNSLKYTNILINFNTTMDLFNCDIIHAVSFCLLV